jgi:hypothetical protein
VWTFSGFPGNLSGTLVEIFENEKPMLVERPSWPRTRPGWAGTVAARAMHFQVRSESDTPITAGLRADRLAHPAQASSAGALARRAMVLLNGTPQHPKRTVICARATFSHFRTPGGGGYGDPPRSELQKRLAEDRSSGLVAWGDAMPVLEACVVGAGTAGLVAARELTRAGFTVRVLEARARVGDGPGRILEPFGVPIDRGCACCTMRRTIRGPRTRSAHGFAIVERSPDWQRYVGRTPLSRERRERWEAAWQRARTPSMAAARAGRDVPVSTVLPRDLDSGPCSMRS